MKIFNMVLLMATLFLLAAPKNAEARNNTDTLSFRVEGLCGACKTRIENASLSTRGVETASWDVETKILSISFRENRFREDRLHYNIASAGHDTRLFHAPDPVYKTLPGCCKYRDFDSHEKAQLAAAGISDREGELDIELEEVSVSHHSLTSSASVSSIGKAIHIHEDELCKAACCNLSESFETNPTVDASFTDAVTGIRKIEMLGLAGPYVQITRENMPYVRGLTALSGLTHTPAIWIESMQLNMGSGSVVNGFESISGQINLELRKPETADRLLLNTHGNSHGRMEAGIMGNVALGKHWDAGLMVHGGIKPFGTDHNGDGFLDQPTGNNLMVLNRYSYSGENGFSSQVGFKVLGSDLHGGQTGFDHERPAEEQSLWGSNMRTQKMEVWAKAGKVFQDRPFTSIGLQLSGMYYNQNAFFGLRNYQAQQQSFYSNLIYQSFIGNINHQYRTGLSLQADQSDEEFALMEYARRELVPGAFLEYTYNHHDRITMVAGLRGDYHNSFGFFLTPRLHLRLEPYTGTIFRVSAGRGQKTASVLSENIGLMASSRSFIMEGSSPEGAYGFAPESAWTYGLNFQQVLWLGHRKAGLQADYFFTNFNSQVVVDIENSSLARFYELQGISRAHSFQIQTDIELLEGLDLRLAGRYNDPKTTYGDRLSLRPLTSTYRVLANVAYETSSHWNFDFTWNWQGKKRIPSTVFNPEEFQLPANSPAFSLFNLQVGKQFGKIVEVYAGIENLLNYTQKDPILASGDPFGPYFDASIVWGPIMGRKFYMNLRFHLPGD